MKSFSHSLKPLKKGDFGSVREVYGDSIRSQGELFYTKDQIHAWEALVLLPGFFDQTLEKGKGWLSFEKAEIAAFAVRYPMNRLALLYCRGNFSRHGHSTALLQKLENEARDEGRKSLYTEASLFSYPLLLKRGWHVLELETIKIGGVYFERYRMKLGL